MQTFFYTLSPQSDPEKKTARPSSAKTQRERYKTFHKAINPKAIPIKTLSYWKEIAMYTHATSLTGDQWMAN